MRELGLFDEFLELPHQKFYELNAQFGEMRLTVADFRYLPSRCGFIALMPQWDFLNFLARESGALSEFRFQDGSRGDRPDRGIGPRGWGSRENDQG